MEDVHDLLRHHIRVIRGHKVLLDTDLADLYGVETRTLVQAVKRNPDRFPIDFMFQLTEPERDNLKSQFVISSWKLPAQAEILRSQELESTGWGGRRTPPYAFTEQGVAMLSSVLRHRWVRTVVRMDADDPVPHATPPPQADGSERSWLWHALWKHAHHEMAAWNRRPAPYLIDSLLDPRKRHRRWLRHHLAELAQVTREREADAVQPDGTLRWDSIITAPDGRRRRIRILVNDQTNELFNAFPE
jgi:hypothetical protein